MHKKIQSKEEFYIQFDDHELEKLGWKNGDKLSITDNDDGSIQIRKFSEIELDFSDYSKETLCELIKLSCDKDISINDVIGNILQEQLNKIK